MDAPTIATCRREARLVAPAKVNLGLRIVGRRADGYHLLESFFVPIGFFDELTLAPDERTTLATAWADDAPFPERELPPAESNLVMKALSGLPDRLGEGWRVSLKKRIPMGAGLGGGSSDAGAVLRFFRRQNPIAVERLATQLGADVPFFLDPRPTWVTGIGECRARVRLDAKLAALRLLIVLLPGGVETKLAFRRYRESGRAFSRVGDSAPGDSLDLDGLQRFFSRAGNDLEDVASQQFPLIANVLSRLRSVPSLYAGMSGSGATCFAVFKDLAALEKNIKGLIPFFRESSCRTIIADIYNLKENSDGDH